MAFFSRPNLDDVQFKQLSGTTLTLSGTTIFDKNDGGLTLSDENGIRVPVVISSSGRTDQNVLKYVGNAGCGCLVLGQVSSGGTSTGFYPYDECSTCTVGGLPSGSYLYNETIADILHDILVPTLYPTLSSPYSVFSIAPSTTPLEVGTQVIITGSTSFNQGSINPYYLGTPPYSSTGRTGAAVAYSFSQWGAPYVTGGSNTCVFASRTITLGSNTAYGCVNYAAGQQPLDSEGNPYLSACTAGSTNSTCSGAIISRTITGIYPYFYGVSDSAPVAGSALLTGGTKQVAVSSGNVAINFNAIDKYLWLAIPNGTSKVRWTGSNNVTNTESIPGSTFPAKTTVSVNSPNIPARWSGINYDFYISNYKTTTCEGGSFYTMTFTNS